MSDDKEMAEAGIDISNQAPKHIDTLQNVEFDYVITLCDNAREYCPAFSGKAKLVHRPFEDPSFMTGTEEQIMTAFRTLRDDMKAFIEKMPECLRETVK